MHDCERQIIESLEHAAHDAPTPGLTISFAELAALMASLQLEVEQEAGPVEQSGLPV